MTSGKATTAQICAASATCNPTCASVKHMSDSSRKEFTAFRISPEQLAAADKLAAKTNSNRSDVFRAAIAEHLERNGMNPAA